MRPCTDQAPHQAAEADMSVHATGGRIAACKVELLQHTSCQHPGYATLADRNTCSRLPACSSTAPGRGSSARFRPGRAQQHRQTHVRKQYRRSRLLFLGDPAQVPQQLQPTNAGNNLYQHHFNKVSSADANCSWHTPSNLKATVMAPEAPVTMPVPRKQQCSGQVRWCAHAQCCAPGPCCTSTLRQAKRRRAGPETQAPASLPGSTTATWHHLVTLPMLLHSMRMDKHLPSSQSAGQQELASRPGTTGQSNQLLAIVIGWLQLAATAWLKTPAPCCAGIYREHTRTRGPLQAKQAGWRDAQLLGCTRLAHPFCAGRPASNLPPLAADL